MTWMINHAWEHNDLAETLYYSLDLGLDKWKTSVWMRVARQMVSLDKFLMFSMISMFLIFLIFSMHFTNKPPVYREGAHIRKLQWNK